MERGKYQKPKLVQHLGEVEHNGITYRVVRERIPDTGDEYIAIKLYNAKGKFIKRLMIEPEIWP